MTDWPPNERRALIRAQEDIAANTAGINKKLDALLTIITMVTVEALEHVKQQDKA